MYKVTVVRKIKNIGVNFLATLVIDLDKIQCAATTCCFVEAHAKFNLHMYYSRERTLLT